MNILYQARRRGLKRISATSLSLVTLSLVTLFCSSCVERDHSPRFIVTHVSPEMPSPEDELTIFGRGFSLNEGTLRTGTLPSRHVSIGGRSLIVSQWTPSMIRATLPPDVPTGERVLVVSRDHVHSPDFPIFVIGEGGERPSNPPDFSFFERDQGDLDMSVDMSQVTDQGLGMPLSVTLDDPNAQVVLSAERRVSEGELELWVSLVARAQNESLWGAASHLIYPSDRLEFLQMTSAPGPTVSAVTGAPDRRVMWYRGDLESEGDGRDLKLMTLRFRVISPNDPSPIRLTIPPRSATLRGPNNQRLSGSWSGGLIEIGEGEQ